jgi:hypothetical protein
MDVNPCLRKEVDAGEVVFVRMALDHEVGTPGELGGARHDAEGRINDRRGLAPADPQRVAVRVLAVLVADDDSDGAELAVR